MTALAEPLRRACDQALATVSWVSGFDFPDVEGDYRFVSLRTPGRYPIESGRVVSSDGLDLTASGFDKLVVEEHVARSTALHVCLGGELEHSDRPAGPLRAGIPSVLPEVASQAAAGAGLGPDRHQPLPEHCRAPPVELVFACDEALRLVGVVRAPEPTGSGHSDPAGCGRRGH